MNSVIFVTIFIASWLMRTESRYLLTRSLNPENMNLDEGAPLNLSEWNPDSLMREILSNVVDLSLVMQESENVNKLSKNKLAMPNIYELIPRITKLLQNVSIAVVKFLNGSRRSGDTDNMSLLKSKAPNVECKSVDVNNNYQVKVCKKK